LWLGLGAVLAAWVAAELCLVVLIMTDDLEIE